MLHSRKMTFAKFDCFNLICVICLLVLTHDLVKVVFIYLKQLVTFWFNDDQLIKLIDGLVCRLSEIMFVSDLLEPSSYLFVSYMHVSSLN